VQGCDLRARESLGLERAIGGPHLGKTNAIALSRRWLQLPDMARVVGVNQARNGQGRPPAGLFGLRVFAQPDARQGVKRRLFGLLGRHRAVPSKNEALLGDGSPASARPIFQNENLESARRDPHAKAFDRVVEDGVGPLARAQRVNRPLADFEICRHRVATKKATERIVRKHGKRLASDISMTCERLST